MFMWKVREFQTFQQNITSYVTSCLRNKLRKLAGSGYFQRRDLERGGLFFLGLCLDLERERNSWLNALFYPSLNHFMCFLCPFVKIKDFFCLTQPTAGDHLDPALKNRVLCASSCDSCKLGPKYRKHLEQT